MTRTHMENKTVTYYTLRYEHTDSLRNKGERIAVPSGDLRIGELDDCTVRFKNTTPYEDEQYAVIRPTRNKGEWQIIPTSEYVSTNVNGMQVQLVHYLNDGDRITFGNQEQELLFNIHHDDKIDVTKGVQMITGPMSMGLIVFLISLPVVLFLFIAGILIQDHFEDIMQKELISSLHSSVLKISVDSVLYIESTSQGDSILDSYSYRNAEGHVVSGTAFLTDDARIVTARHCIEPWLNDTEADKANSPDEVSSLPTRWAMEAETYNQLHGQDTIRRVVSICKFGRGKVGYEVFGKTYRSSQFEVDTSRDHLVEKGDYDHVYFWRSIRETPSYREMILGDVAWIECDSIGRIRIAPHDMMVNLLSAKPTLHFIGYPEYTTDNSIDNKECSITKDYESGNLIVHNCSLPHGYSGAAAIVIHGDEAFAVGVVSRLDANGAERSYSVPIVELKKRKETVNE